MTDQAKPPEGEPVEPTNPYRVDPLRSMGLDVMAPAWDEGCGAGRAFERSARERKRGERPVNPQCRGSWREGWEHGFARAVEWWAESGDSDELAELREKLEACEIACLHNCDQLVRAKEELDAEKARADRAEKREQIYGLEMVERGKTITQAKARIAELESDLGTANAIGAGHCERADAFSQRIAELEASRDHQEPPTEHEIELAERDARIGELERRIHEFEMEEDSRSESLQKLKTESAGLRGQLDKRFKELADAREELRLQEPIIELARVARNQCVPDLQAPFAALDDHRAKPSPQSTSSADSEAQQTSPGGPDQGADNTDPSKTGEQSPLEEARNLSGHLPYETTPTLEKGVKCARCDGNGFTVYGASVRTTCYDCDGSGKSVVRVESAPNKLAATLDRIEANQPHGKVTEADGPLFIPEPADDGPRECCHGGMVCKTCQWFDGRLSGAVAAALPTSAEDERVVDGLMAKAQEGRRETPMRMMGPLEDRMRRLEDMMIMKDDVRYDALAQEIRAERARPLNTRPQSTEPER